MKRAVILLSGGLDSVTTLAIAHQQGFECYTLSFDYGQRHNVELNAAVALSKQMGAKQHKVKPNHILIFFGMTIHNHFDHKSQT